MLGMVAIEIIFWISVGLIVYALIGYPLLTLLLAAMVRHDVDKKPVAPPVSFIIAAYNEADVIADKISQTLALDYPADKLEVIVASDGSTDGTAAQALAAGARVVHEPRRGYGAACFAGAKASKHADIIVFLDGDYSDDPGELSHVAGPVLEKVLSGSEHSSAPLVRRLLEEISGA